MLDRIGHAETKRDLFGCPAGKLGKDQELKSSGITFFRKGSDDPKLGQIVTEADDRGFLVGVSRAAGHRRRIFHETHATEHDFEHGSVYIRNLADRYRADLAGAFDFFLLEVSRTFLVELAQEHGWRGGVDLACQAGVVDPTLSHLAAAVEQLLDGRGKINPLFVDQLGITIGIHLMQNYASARSGALTSRQIQLSPKQIETARSMLNEPGSHSIADVARACGVSRGYFIQGFKEATGQTPHRWVMSQRTEQARSMMLKTKFSLADIALACGFADQSHFSRVFSRANGMSPGSWRRIARSG